MNVHPFEYMRWAKSMEYGGPEIFLARSGMPAPTRESLGVRLEDIELRHRRHDGDPEVRGRLAARYGLPEEQVVLAAGTSQANFLICAALLDPGDVAVVETPTYEALPRLVELVGAQVRPLPRHFEEDWRVEPDRLREVLTDRTRLVFLTSLHNPTGVAIPEETMRELGRVAEEVGARVVVDEVYLEYLPPGEIPPAATLGDTFVSTSSITKTYGLGGLRLGWAAGALELMERVLLVNDLIDVECAAPSQRIAARLFERADEIRAGVERHLASNLAVFEEWRQGRGDVDLVPPAGGASLFARLPEGVPSRELAQVLLDNHGTAVVPGDFFGAPGFLRIGIGGEEGELRAGLERLGLALDTFGSTFGSEEGDAADD